MSLPSNITLLPPQTESIRKMDESMSELRRVILQNPDHIFAFIEALLSIRRDILACAKEERHYE